MFLCVYIRAYYAHYILYMAPTAKGRTQHKEVHSRLIAQLTGNELVNSQEFQPAPWGAQLTLQKLKQTNLMFMIVQQNKMCVYEFENCISEM